MEEFGFIVIRHVISSESNRYWQTCCDCIRKYYPESPIVIIDDNSDDKFNQDMRRVEADMANTTVVQSEFPGCGELLAYYYLYKNRYFHRAVIVHDSVFIHERIDFSVYDKVRFLWHFTHEWDNEPREVDMLQKTGYQDLDYIYGDFSAWMGCFGVMSVIELSFLENMKGIFNLVPIVKTRSDRKCIERVFGLMCCYFHKPLIQNPSILGIIHTHYKGWRYTYDAYLRERHPSDVKMIKVWTGR